MNSTAQFRIGDKLIHSCEGDVGVVIGFRYDDRCEQVVYNVSGCKVPLPQDELRLWSIYQDGSLIDAYRQLRCDSAWSSSAVDGFVCVESRHMETLVSLELAEKKLPCWYKPVNRLVQIEAQTANYWCD